MTSNVNSLFSKESSMPKQMTPKWSRALFDYHIYMLKVMPSHFWFISSFVAVDPQYRLRLLWTIDMNSDPTFYDFMPAIVCEDLDHNWTTNCIESVISPIPSSFRKSYVFPPFDLSLISTALISLVQHTSATVVICLEGCRNNKVHGLGFNIMQ